MAEVGVGVGVGDEGGGCSGLVSRSGQEDV